MALHASFTDHFYYHLPLNIINLGLHSSLVLGREEELLDAIDLEVIKAIDRDIEVEVSGVSVYRDARGKKLIFALNVESASMLQIRWNLGLDRKPEELNLHISLFEIDM